MKQQTKLSPARGRGLKRARHAPGANKSGLSPARGRGLKRGPAPILRKRIRVVARARAWIETRDGG